MQQLNWCALDALLPLLWGVLCVHNCIIVYAYNMFRFAPLFATSSSENSELQNAQQPLALSILSFRMLKVAESNWSLKKNVMNPLRFGMRKILLFFFPSVKRARC